VKWLAFCFFRLTGNEQHARSTAAAASSSEGTQSTAGQPEDDIHGLGAYPEEEGKTAKAPALKLSKSTDVE